MQYPDIDVEIFEGASRIGEVGAGIAIWPRKLKLLMLLGMIELVMCRCLEDPSEARTG